jgi:2-desacetyl-2-hydroxyethyl bacteriochlorophyllide A dehydrogenase
MTNTRLCVGKTDDGFGKAGSMHNIGIEFTARGEMGFYGLGTPPAPEPTQILIRTYYSGITNGTERHALMGDFGYGGGYPGRHGYQHVGIIEAVGSDVKAFSEGDMVFFGHYVGHRGWHIVAVGAGDPTSYNQSHLCLKLPDEVDHQVCALLGVTGVGMRHIRRIGVKPAQNVWVAGLGPIGQGAAQSARAFGAHVTVTDLNPKRLEVARELGAHRAINVSDPDSMELLKQGRPYDRIVDACGTASLFEDIRKNGLLAYRGAIGAVAVRGEITFQWGMLHGLEGSIEVSCHFSLDDLRVILHFMKLNVMKLEPLVSHRIPIKESPSIYKTMRDNPGELLGVIFDWTR